MSGSHFERALLLFDQSRFDLAETELRQTLAEEPDHALAHAFLALCLCDRKEFQLATAEAETAIHLSPDLAFAHFALARVFQSRHRVDEALEAIREAIRLEPLDADYHAELASLRLEQRLWPEALAAAEEGLRCDAEHTNCINLRAMALVKLGRKKEAGQTIDAALARNPENSMTHANQGWTYVEKGEYEKGLEHFREALRLDPENDWARQGILEALKARHWIYALMLRYFLWMSKLSRGVQWGIILGLYFLQRILSAVARTNPELKPFITPLLFLYLIFVVLTWIANPLFNLLLRLNRFGRLALSREQTISSNFLGACLALSLACLAASVVTGQGGFFLGAIVAGLLCMPVAGIFKCHAGWPRTVMTVVTVLLLLAGLGAVLEAWSGSERPKSLSANPLASLFFWGILISTIGVNYLSPIRPKQ
jgi:tetratricopeptide (TPR) repeat protein